MPTITKDELQERAQLVRTHEANCKIEHPSVDEANFRLAVMKKLGLAFGLRELRSVTIAGPVKQFSDSTPLPPRQAPPAPAPQPGKQTRKS